MKIELIIVCQQKGGGEGDESEREREIRKWKEARRLELDEEI